MTLLAGYLLHVSSAPHQKHCISLTHSPQDEFLCRQVCAGLEVGGTVVGVVVLFIVTGTVVEVVDESEVNALVNGDGVVEMLLAVIAVRHKQIARKT